MNCRPGDLARIIVPGAYFGCLVNVLHVAPPNSFRLPDGQKHMGMGPDRWVIESLGKPFSAPVQTPEGFVMRDARFGCARDDQLRPIRDPGEDARDETLDWPREGTGMTDRLMVFCAGFNLAAFLDALAQHDWLLVFILAVALALAALCLFVPETKEAA